MANTKQLGLALHLYTGDYNEYLPPNDDTFNAGWLTGNMDYSGGEANTNRQYLINPKWAKLGPYTTDPGIYKCPADQSKSRGNKGPPRVRSVSMSQNVGTQNSPPGTKTINGPWLDGAHGHTANKTWFCYGKMTDFIAPGPSKTWIFVDEHPDSINDGGFGVSMATSAWVDYPANYHNNACGFNFADNHSEIKKWRSGSIPKVTYKGLSGIISVKGDPDIKWVQERTSAKVRD